MICDIQLPRKVLTILKLKELIEFIVDNYPIRNSPVFSKVHFKGNPAVRVLNKGLNSVENNFLFLTSPYLSKGSAGQGGWAIIPWIGLFDKDISTSAEKGFYIVYLFSADLKRVYLSLNQGWSFYSKVYGRTQGLTNIHDVAVYWRENLINRTERMSIKKIELNASKFKTNLPEGYERGNILSIVYDTDDLPSNEVFITDLLDMKIILKELKTKMISYKDFEHSIDYILSKRGFSIAEESADYNIKPIDTRKKIKQSAGPQEAQEIVLSHRHVNKVNYELKERNSSKVGFLGETLILEYERQRLIAANRKDLADTVEQVSETQGDGLGYDIKSYDITGKSLYIEVKTTVNNINTPFYISKNELDASHLYQDKYILARVYNLRGDYQFYKITGDLSKKLQLYPQSYRAFPLNK